MSLHLLLWLLAGVCGAPMKGYVYTSWCLPDCWPNATQDTARMASLGVEVVEIMFTWYVQNTTTATKVYPCQNSPKDEDVIRVIRIIQNAGMKVAMKPHIDGEDGTWRAYIGTHYTTEQQWNEFFGNYTDFILHFAEIGVQTGIVGFNIGTELDGTHLQEARWRTLINATRVVLGKNIPIWLGPNWDWNGVWGYKRVQFWDALDFFGVDMYSPVSATPDPSLALAERGWGPIIGNLSEWWQQQGEPKKGVIFAEIGFASFGDAAVHPNLCCTGPPDLSTQSILFQSFFSTAWQEPWMAGVFWWAWSDVPDLNPQNDTSFDIWGKPATDVVKKAYST